MTWMDIIGQPNGGEVLKTNNKTLWTGLVAGLMLTAPVFAQQIATFRAQMRGGGDHGKCTIEVDVDGVAEIEIQGDQGRMRTLSGNPSGWRRMECNQPLPPNPVDFRFSGVDGRGRQTLLRDPSSNRGVAVIRIEDPQGGHEGYTFDIEWAGAGGGFDRGNGGGRPIDPRAVEGGRPRDDGPRWNDEIRFTGRGDGYFKNFRGPDEVLRDCEVSIDRRGIVTVTFRNGRRSPMTFTGQLTHFDRERVVADMSGRGIRGSMEIQRNGPDRITAISMSAEGRERFDLSWRR
jgi:hypothetical protein